MNRFYDYILTYVDDDNAIGDLARDIEDDDMFPTNEKDTDRIRNYFDHYIKNNRMKEIAFEALECFENGKWI